LEQALFWQFHFVEFDLAAQVGSHLFEGLDEVVADAGAGRTLGSAWLGSRARYAFARSF